MKSSNGDKWSVNGKLVKVGDKFGRLTVTAIFRQRARVNLQCLCECGTQFRTQARHVVTGATISCGCFRKTHVGGINRDKRRKAPGHASFLNLFHTYRAQARKRSLEFSILQEEFKILTKQQCHYCGCPPSQEHCAGFGAYVYNGLDRVDNSGGYTIKNCVPCCNRCNRAKGTASLAEFSVWLKQLVNFQKFRGRLA
jgi:hypothetical protein